MEHVTNLCHQDQPKNSVEEADDLLDLQDVRSYECIYCKHGFTTAQALGGHMNVHRKDRSKNRSNFSNNKSNPRLFQPCLITSCIDSHHHERQTHHEFMLRSSPRIYDINTSGKQRIFNASITSPSQDEMRLDLSLKFGGSNEEYARGDEEEDELDLELRLGNY